jgi:hypothetical protein
LGFLIVPETPNLKINEKKKRKKEKRKKGIKRKS